MLNLKLELKFSSKTKLPKLSKLVDESESSSLISNFIGTGKLLTTGGDPN